MNDMYLYYMFLYQSYYGGKSREFWSKYDMPSVLKRDGIFSLTVYVDKNDLSKYFLDDAPLESIWAVKCWIFKGFIQRL